MVAGHLPLSRHYGSAEASVSVREVSKVPAYFLSGRDGKYIGKLVRR